MPAAPPRILVLAGSSEATELVAHLASNHAVEVIASLAGRTAQPNTLAGQVRVGGFGGASGLATWLRDEHICAVVDATHPFAATMPWHVSSACLQVGVPRLRLRRPGWAPDPRARWIVVPDVPGAVRVLEDRQAKRVFLTIGRSQLQPFSVHTDTWFLVRSIDPPDPLPLNHAEVLLERGPFALEHELELIERHRIDTVVTKNSGGSAAQAKLLAASRTDTPVVMIARPPSPPGDTVAAVPAAIEWCGATLGVQLS